MNKSQLFKAAHKLAKSVIKSGDNYRVTFGAAIKVVLAKVATMLKTVEFAIKKGALNRWTHGDMNRAYVANFDYNGGFGLVAELQNNGISAEAAYFDFNAGNFDFKNLCKYNSIQMGMKSFEGTDSQMTVKARNIVRAFLNKELKK